MIRPKISVIIPVYNTAEYLPQCLDSVLMQNLEEIEIVVVIDCSPDNSMEIAQEYQKRDRRITIIEKPVNEGLPVARNSGVDASTGEYIIHLDSDDFWLEPTMLENLYKIARLENCQILRFNGYEHIEGELTPYRILNGRSLTNGCFERDEALWCYRSVFLYLFERNFIDHHNLSFVPDVTLGEDGIFLSAALVLAERVSLTPERYYAYRIRPSGMMMTRWSLNDFLEEETSSQMVAENLSGHQEALQRYLYYRLFIYWVSVMSRKLFRDLNSKERMELYRFARANFIRLQSTSVHWWQPQLMPGKLFHKFFQDSDYQRLDKAVWFASILARIWPSAQYLFQFASRLSRETRCLGRWGVGFTAYRLWPLLGKERRMVNREGLTDYNIFLPRSRYQTGVSALLRVKNEEKRIEACLDSILEIFDEIIVVDNGSEDSTRELLEAFKSRWDRSNKIRVFSYPHRVARCGSEHASTSQHSVHSLAYYYNWCLEKCSLSLVCKWDADMVFSSQAGRKIFSDFLTELTGRKVFLLGAFPVQTVYIDKESLVYEADGEINEEPRIFPNSSVAHFEKKEEWEALCRAVPLPVARLEDVCCYEVRDVSEDEYSHWSTTQFKGAKKIREYRNFQKVKHDWHRTSGFTLIDGL
jgi:glycosyltransferase involved in cell wall biosynthesis